MELCRVPVLERADVDIALSVDLVAASHRSDTFPQEWNDERRRFACGRYRKWLALKRDHLHSAMAPTHDIDLFWHLHMLSPVAYYRDCMANFGKLLDHDGGFGKAADELPLLKQVFLRTASWWEKKYREPYRDDGRWLADQAAIDCWHDCQDRCWHACSDGK